MKSTKPITKRLKHVFLRLIDLPLICQTVAQGSDREVKWHRFLVNSCQDVCVCHASRTCRVFWSSCALSRHWLKSQALLGILSTMWISNFFVCFLGLFLQTSCISTHSKTDSMDLTQLNQTQTHSVRAAEIDDNGYSPDDVPTEQDIKKNFSGDWLFHVRTTACHLIWMVSLVVLSYFYLLFRFCQIC